LLRWSREAEAELDATAEEGSEEEVKGGFLAFNHSKRPPKIVQKHLADKILPGLSRDCGLLKRCSRPRHAPWTEHKMLQTSYSNSAPSSNEKFDLRRFVFHFLWKTYLAEKFPQSAESK
jgi:hypothetical protein